VVVLLPNTQKSPTVYQKLLKLTDWRAFIFFRMLYSALIRPLLFHYTDPETAHRYALRTLRLLSQRPLKTWFQTFYRATDPKLAITLGGLYFPSPVGLAAGFDKHIDAPNAYGLLGFGSAEFGSITLVKQPGNQTPRVWRLPKDKGLIVNYGLPSIGAEQAKERLEKQTARTIPYGVSVAPSTNASDLVLDYATTFSMLYDTADYITLNVSCPNVTNQNTFSQLTFIEKLLATVASELERKNSHKPLFLKIAPHYSNQELEKIVSLCKKYHVQGIVATNLLKKRSFFTTKSSPKELEHPGGISGELLKNDSNTIIAKLFHLAHGELTIIGVGGIFSAEDAYEKIRLGANAVQLVTGFIYGGPSIARTINKRLLYFLQRDGFSSISEAVGSYWRT
jgi:dihydroorotate dehydrogenase